ncbi:hypothetical protein C8R43DRAFT_940887 [Mycena crocata]|nr:hypothetical protein C8R43DRAFT_940887 [Mycena crocata]
MPPRGWTTPEEFAWLAKQMGAYIKRQAAKKLYKFWPQLHEGYFHEFPEERRLGFDPATATPEDWKNVKKAVELKKKQLENWFRHQKSKLAKVPSARLKSSSSLASALFSMKPTRRRVHQPIEIYQKRNAVLIRETLTAQGFDQLNEGHMAMVVDGEEEAQEVQSARVKSAQKERMRVRTTVVRELFANAPELEREAIEAEIQEEKKAMKGKAVIEVSSDSKMPDELQIAIDESQDVMEKVLKAFAEQTGWFGFTVWGGPNPRLNGDLSMKYAAFGETPAGNDFIGAHPQWDEGVSAPFQAFLKRCFSEEARLARAKLVTEIDALPFADAEVPVPVPPTQAPKKKKKSKHPKKPAAATIPAITVNPVATISTPVLPSAASALSVETANTSAPPSSPAPETGDVFGGRPIDYGAGGMESERQFSLDDGGGMESAPQFSLDDGGMDIDPQIVLDDGAYAPSLPSSAVPTISQNSWPAGMPPPSTPTAAAREALIERGGFSSAGPTYAAAQHTPDEHIDPALHPRPRPCYTGAAFANTNRSVMSSPLVRTRSFGGFNFPVPAPAENLIDADTERKMQGLFSSYRSHVSNSPSRGITGGSGAATVNPVARWGALGRPAPGLTSFAPFAALPKPSAPTTAPVPASTPSPTTTPSAAPTPTPSAPTATPTAALTPTQTAVPLSRPMANIPKASKPPAAETGTKKKAVGRRTVENGGVAKVKAPAKGGKKTKEAKALTDIANLFRDLPPPPAPTTTATASTTAVTAAAMPPAAPAPVLIYTTTNNLRARVAAENRARRAAEAQAKAAAAPAPPHPLHNPDGNYDLVIVPSRRPERARKAPTPADADYVGKPKVAGRVKKLTHGEQMAAKNAPSEEALLKRGEKKRAAETQAGPARKQKKMSK